MIGIIWNTIIKAPLVTTLVWLTDITGNTGISIILLTLIIQIIFIPLRVPSIKSSLKMKKIKPEIDSLKDKHKDDKMAQGQAQMDLYKKHGINPWGGILPLLLSLPILIALYQVINTTLVSVEGLPTSFLWLDVTRPDPYFILPLFVAGAQFLSMKQLITEPGTKVQEQNTEKKKSSNNDMSQQMQTQMKYLMPAMTGFITLTLPAGVGLYWITSVVFAIIQQKFVQERFYAESEQSQQHGS